MLVWTAKASLKYLPIRWNYAIFEYKRKGQFRGGETVTRELTITIDYPECPHDEDELVELFKTMASYIEGFHVTFQDRSIEKKEE